MIREETWISLCFLVSLGHPRALLRGIRASAVWKKFPVSGGSGSLQSK